jgi:osmoprotectant transport system substrate-binding protein
MNRGLMLAAGVFIFTTVASAQVVIASTMDTDGGLLGNWLVGGEEVKLIVSPDFAKSPGALPKFEEAYGFSLSADQLVIVDAAMVYGTDDDTTASGLVVLEDDKGVQPVYEPAPLLSEAILEKYPEVADWLASVFAKLDLPTLHALNGRVQVGGEASQSVAIDWLRSKGFIS